MQASPRVIMGPTELKMQPRIHFQKKPDILTSVASSFQKCSVGCIFRRDLYYSYHLYKIIFLAFEMEDNF
jgi:hypothetical protein